MRILPTLATTLGLTAVVGGGLVAHPQLLDRVHPTPTAVAAVNTASVNTASVNTAAADAAARQTVVAGMNPVTGQNSSAGLEVDRSLLGLPVVPNTAQLQLPELALVPPTVGRPGAVVTVPRNVQVGTTAVWQAQQKLDGPVRRVVKNVAAGAPIVIPPEAGQLHLLCGEGAGAYYVDSHLGEWRVYRTDGGPHYDVQYRFVQYDRSPLALQDRCR